MSNPTVAILTLAADKLESGAWHWNDGTQPSDETHRDLVLTIYGAAAELDLRDFAYWALMAVGRKLADPFRSPFYRVPGRTEAEVIAALRETAAASSAQVAA